MSLTYTEAELFLRAGFEMRRRSWPPDAYVRVHLVTPPPPDTLPSDYGEAIERYEPTADDLEATDWERV